MPCVPWRDGYMIRPLHSTTRNDADHALGAVSQERRQHLHSAALTESYTTHHPEGNLGVRCHVSASVASAPRGGVACNDAAIRQEGPILGWVRERRIRDAHKHAYRKGR